MGIQEFPTPNTGLNLKVPNLALPLPASDGSVILDQCVYVTQDIQQDTKQNTAKSHTQASEFPYLFTSQYLFIEMGQAELLYLFYI